MNFWKRVKEGVTTFLAGTLLFSSLNAAPIKPNSVLDFVQSLPKEKEVINYNNLDFMLGKKHDLNDIIENKDDCFNAYIGPSNSFGKNILRESINWQGKEISEKVSVYCDKGLEEILDGVSYIAKEAVDEYEEIYGHKLEKDVRIYIYNSYRYGQTNLSYIGVPRSLGGFFNFRKWNIIIPWRNNDFVHDVTRHELAHVYQTERIYKEYLKAWKILYNKAISSKPLVMPLWIIEGDAERTSRGLTKHCTEMMSDLIRHNIMTTPDKFPEGSLPMYVSAQHFFSYLDEKYGKEKPNPLWDNYYDIFRDLEETFDGEDIFGNKVKKEKIKVNPIWGPLFSKKDILNYAFNKTYGKNLEQLFEDWLKDSGNLYFKEQDIYDELEDVATKVCPENFSFFPVLNKNNFAYVTLNKNRTQFELKIVKDNSNNTEKWGKGEYKIKTISDGSQKITRFKVIEGSRMDMNKDYLIVSAMVDDQDKLFLYNLKTEKLESKGFKDIIEINDPTISHDSKYMAFSGLSKKNGRSNIYVYDRERGKLEKLTKGIYFKKDLDFSPDSYDLVYACDKTKHKKNYDIFKIKNLDKNNIERIICNDADDASPRFGPEGSILFISDRNGKDNVFLLNPENNTVHQVTNLITPVKDVFYAENKKEKDQILITYFNKLAYNIAKIEKADIKEVTKGKIDNETPWEYKKGCFKDKKFKRRWGGWPENLAFGGNSNGFYLATHFSDGIREKHILPVIFIDFNKIKNSDILLTYADFSNKIPYVVGLERFVYVHPEKWGDVNKDKSIVFPYPDEVMDVVKGRVSFNYPLNLNERLENTLSVVHSTHDSKDFFGGAWQEFYIYEESFREFWKGLRIKNVFSFVKDNRKGGFKGPIEGYGLKINLRTSFDPKGLEKITSFAVDGTLKKYNKLGKFGVFSIRGAAGYGSGKEFEQFGIGDVRTIRGYGLNKIGTIPKYYGDGYYLFNAEISQIPLIKAVVPFWNKAHHGLDGSIYVDVGNVFDDLKGISGPKASIGVGLSTYFLMVPMHWYISLTGDGLVTQFHMGYNF